MTDIQIGIKRYIKYAVKNVLQLMALLTPNQKILKHFLRMLLQKITFLYVHGEIEKLIEKFGKENYTKDPHVYKIVNCLVYGHDPVELLVQLLNINKSLSESLEKHILNKPFKVEASQELLTKQLEDKDRQLKEISVKYKQWVDSDKTAHECMRKYRSPQMGGQHIAHNNKIDNEMYDLFLSTLNNNNNG